MRTVDIIEKTRNKIELSEEEIKFLINGYVEGTIPDYQMSAWLMAVYFNSLTKNETFTLVDSMLRSGDVIDLSDIDGYKVDKHSTGGVGDKVTIILAPLVASLGLKMPTLSGRGLGNTGGTLDKLESIPGLNVFLTEEQYKKQLKDIGCVITGQTGNLVPADKKMYALRDVTATVNSYPLISSSIMSKKIASGIDILILDVKYGTGAFMKTKEQAEILSNLMVEIGKAYNKKCICLIDDMNHPLGKAVGNALEIKESVDTLLGKGPLDLVDLTCTISGYMLLLTNKVKTLEEGYKLSLENLNNGKAYQKFIDMIDYQGATTHDFDSLIKTKEVIPVYSKESGYIEKLDALTIGVVSMKLGAGRETKEASVDPSVGILLNKQLYDYAEKGEPLLYIYKNDKWSDSLIDEIYSAYSFSDKKIEMNSNIYKVIE